MVPFLWVKIGFFQANSLISSLLIAFKLVPHLRMPSADFHCKKLSASASPLGKLSYCNSIIINLSRKSYPYSFAICSHWDSRIFPISRYRNDTGVISEGYEENSGMRRRLISFPFCHLHFSPFTLHFSPFTLHSQFSILHSQFILFFSFPLCL